MPSAVSDVRDLIVWQLAMTLAERCYRLARNLPPDERFGMALQLRRASVSVASNIAEGYGRRSPRDYSRFLGFANGSAREVETQLLLSVRLGLLAEADVAEAVGWCGQIGRMLTVLLRRLRG